MRSRTNTSGNIAGYLVVLQTMEAPPPGYVSLNPKYRGVYRMPYYPPSFPDEANAVDAYVFDGYRHDETGVIPTLDRALQLLEMFRVSSRSYQLIYISTAPFGPPADDIAIQELGFDVAGIGGDFHSIVYDFPKFEPLYPFLSRLNDAGLFSDEATAEEFLNVYRSKSDRDIPFAVFKVSQVI